MKVFLTGATGFIGRALIDELDASRCELVTCLVRDPARLAGAHSRPTYVRAVRGDLLDPTSYETDLAGIDVVCHLAAAVGRVRAQDHERVNVEGTSKLLQAAERQGVRRFVHVSTIAVNFPDKSASPYGRTKEEAESRVKSSRLDWAIVRPTIVLGPGSGWGLKLDALARAPIPFTFGSGRARLQPIHVRDVARFLAGLVQEETLGGDTIELGGPEALTFDDFFARVRGGPTRVLHVPTAPLSLPLQILERALPVALPVTAGQFLGFVFDTTAAPHARVERLLPQKTSLEKMITGLGESVP